jgi:hypothetical protein
MINLGGLASNAGGMGPKTLHRTQDRHIPDCWRSCLGYGGLQAAKGNRVMGEHSARFIFCSTEEEQDG